MDFEDEKFFNCPHCGEKISMLLEELYGSQTYIEDCETCCRPIEITYEIKDEKITYLEAKKVQ